MTLQLPEPAIRPDAGRALTAIINTGSAAGTRRAPAEMAAILEAAGQGEAKILCARPSDLDRTLDEAIAGAGILAVLGGDGTLRAAAAKCGQSSTCLIPLPGGTMNMLPRALYGARDWRRALADTLADPVVREISGGRANGHPFFVAALLGAPTLWAEAREALRTGRLVEAARRASTAIRRGMSEPLAYEFGPNPPGSAEAVVVMCPLVSKVMREDERRFEAAAIDTRTAGALLRLGFNTLLDDWRGDPDVLRAEVMRAIVSGHGRVPVILDGERVRLGRKVTIDFVPLAFRALAPAEAHGPAARTAAAA
jgi:diacylglycerol kinase family enzyme